MKANLFTDTIIPLAVNAHSIPTHRFLLNNPPPPLIISHIVLGLNIFILVMCIMLVNNIRKAMKNLKKGSNLLEKFAIILNLFIQDPSLVFSEKAQRDRKGTYKTAYNKYRDLHITSKRNFRATLVVVVLQIFVLGFLIYTFSGFQLDAFAISPTEHQATNFQIQDIE